MTPPKIDWEEIACEALLESRWLWAPIIIGLVIGFTYEN